MSGKWPGGFIKKTAPTVVGPVDGEGGSASGIWTLDQAADYESRGLWPIPTLPRELYVWGLNSSGQLGIGTSGAGVNESSPVQVGALTNWSTSRRTLFGGNNSNGAIKKDNTIWVMGDNGQGQLGTDNGTNYSSPVQLGALTNWKEAAGGNYHTAAVKTDGTLWGWGRNALGQVGDGTTTVRSSPVQVGSLTTWLQVAAGYAWTAAITTDGKLYAWGYNGQGQLGQGNTTNYSSPVQVGALTTWAKVACGQLHVLAIKTDGTLWAWGLNNSGQVGIGTSGSGVNVSSPTQVGALTTWSQVGGLTDASIAIKTDGTLWMWGANTYGQLGDGTITGRSSPVQVGSLTTWDKIGMTGYAANVIKTDGTLWSWGRNNYGQLGLGNTTNVSSPVQVGALTTWSQVRTDNEGSALLAVTQS
jgi:alpha-tubulin suppressor-like RCC1 family protein